MITVAHIVPTFPIGGLRQHVSQVVEATSCRISHVVVSIFSARGSSPCPVSGAKTIALDVPLGAVDDIGLVAGRILDALRDIRADLINTHHVYADIYALDALRAFDHCRAVRTVHGITQFSPSEILSERPLRTGWSEVEVTRELGAESRCGATVCVSNELRSKIVGYGIPPAKVRVVHNGVFAERFERPSASKRNAQRKSMGFDDDDMIVGFMGRLERVKNPLEFIQIAADLTKHSSGKTKFLIQGSGSQTSEVLCKIEQLGLSNVVRLNDVSQDVSSFYGSIDVLAIPSLSEGLPYVALEAMASEVPVVASAVGGLPELITDGMNGFLYDSGCHETAVEKILLLLDAERVREFGSQARRTVCLKFDAREKVGEIESIYVQIAGQGS